MPLLLSKFRTPSRIHPGCHVAEEKGSSSSSSEILPAESQCSFSGDLQTLCCAGLSLLLEFQTFHFNYSLIVGLLLRPLRL